MASVTQLRGRFSTPVIVLHWLIAGLILFNIYLGLKMDGLQRGPDGATRVVLVKLGAVSLGWAVKGSSALLKFTTFQLHKSIGFTVLALSIIRLAVRLLAGGPPPYPATMRPWERWLASATHWGFYALMLGLPITGWIIVSASPTNIPTLLYKTIPMPHLGPIHGLPMATRRGLEAGTGQVHTVLAWTMIVLFVLHTGAALKHQFWNRDGVLYRMLPLGRAPRAV